MSGHRLESSERRMTPVFVPYRGPIAGLRMRNGEVIHRYGTTRDMRAITHKPIPPATRIRLRLPLHPREEPPRPPRPSEEREPSKPGSNVDRKSPELATIMIWDLPHNVNCEELRRVFEGVDGIVAVFYSSFRHLMLVDFVTRKAAHKVKRHYHLGQNMEPLYASRASTQLSMLMRKAYIKCRSWCYFSEALNLDGSNLGGHTLRVTECPGGSKFWHGHITPNGPVTGKRTVFNHDSDNE
ncbi:unnamed protein product [Urochloa decumbens]|uniref:RRM domain-containing protein n=1 Tax=Urochloa decumbens TaxID=240449 RepID=A0ABC9G7L0_9POAL